MEWCQWLLEVRFTFVVETFLHNGIDRHNTSSIQRCSHLDIPTKYQYAIGIAMLIPMVGSLVPLLMLFISAIISPLHHTNIGNINQHVKICPKHIFCSCLGRSFASVKVECIGT